MAKPHLVVDQILAWIDAQHARTGHWPTRDSGRIAGTRGETWGGVDLALRLGRRGLPGGSTLARLVAVRDPGHRMGSLSEEQILAWAEAHRARTGQWPKATSGPIDGIPRLSWATIDHVLGYGSRGLPGGDTLAQLLARCRGVRNQNALPALSVEQVLAWADAHHRRTGAWPMHHSGPVEESPEDTWACMDIALRTGGRGLPGGWSLTRLLAERRGTPTARHRPALTVEQVLRWADAHHERTGVWPTTVSGPILGAAGEGWSAINQALLAGCRGLPGGRSLARLLADARGVPYRKRSRDKLTVKQVLNWARAHRRRTGRWPTGRDGLIPESSGETWYGVNSALRKGSRGLRGGSSLSQLLRKYRRAKARRKGSRGK